jgi:hypothetical protein
MYALGCISTPIGDMFLKNHIWDMTYVHNKWHIAFGQELWEFIWSLKFTHPHLGSYYGILLEIHTCVAAYRLHTPKLCGNQSQIKGILHEDQSTYLPISQLLLEEFSWKLIPRAQQTFPRNFLNFAGIGEELRALYIKKRIYDCISVHIRGTFLKIHICNTTHIPYTWSMFRWNRASTEGTLHTDQSTHSPVISAVITETSSKIKICDSMKIPDMHAKFHWDQSQIKGTLHDQSTYLPIFQLLLVGCPCRFICVTVHIP